MKRGRTLISRQETTLAKALGIARGEVVSLVGGGGKTSALFRLASELASQGGRVVVTTTTHIYPPDPSSSPAVVLRERVEDLVSEARDALERHRAVILATTLNTDGRLAGVDPESIALLKKQLAPTNVLVEADGSKGLPFKAPATHEPVIPASTDLVVPVVGLSVLGRSLSPDLVHRPERVAALAGIELGATITPRVISAVLHHPEGSTRGAPARARIVPLLNQADDDERLHAGRQVARALIECGTRRAVIAALRAEAQPVREVITDGADQAGAGQRGAISAIILAAGEGRRMGRLKLALPWHGKSLLHCAVEAALASSVAEVVVVLGHRAAELKAEVPADGRVRVVYNPDYRQGQSSSLKTGINALSAEAQSVMFLLGDQPLVNAELIESLIDAFRRGESQVVQPRYGGRPGHPVIFGRRLFAELLQVSGDQGGREVLERHRAELVTVDFDQDFPEDIDTMEDYERLVGRAGKP